MACKVLILSIISSKIMRCLSFILSSKIGLKPDFFKVMALILPYGVNIQLKRMDLKTYYYEIIF